jgi:uncharacterized damage-inducible protein DinB
MAAVPEENADYKPAENCMSARELVQHLTFVEIWFLEGILNGEFSNPEDPGTEKKPIAELLAIYDSQVPGLMAKLKDVPADQLAKKTQFFTFNLPLIAYLEFMQRHTVHHRGQLSAYLRPMGAKVPSIYGGSYDEPFTAEANA